LKFEKLPGIPKIWLDFVRSGLPLLTAPPNIEMLVGGRSAVRNRTIGNDALAGILAIQKQVSRKASENLELLSRPESVAVITNIHAGLLGGPAIQVLKCLTAIKICDELKNHAISAIPICWICRDNVPEFPGRSITLLDGDSNLHSFEISRQDPVPLDEVSDVIARIRALGCERCDPETLGIIENAFLPDSSFSSASARLFSALMREWGMIVFDPAAPEAASLVNEALAPFKTKASEIEFLLSREESRLADEGYPVPSRDVTIPGCLVQSALFPVLALVVDLSEIFWLAKALPVFDAMGLAQPLVWPGASATIGDAKSRRVLSRYNIALEHLYSGEEAVLKGIRDAIPGTAPAKLYSLKSEVEARTAELKSVMAARSDILEAADFCRERVTYQIRKLVNRLGDTLDSKEQTAKRRIHRACNLLAPNRKLQETELAAIQIPLRYSSEGLRRLWEKLDIRNFEHQLIWMD
jgi:uncharacterized protein YllA (UPF0747 family)